MTLTPLSYNLELGSGSRPVALSSVQLPIQPSSSSKTEDSPKYEHILTSKAISPRMDLVAILSRDVASPVSNGASGSESLNPSSILAPPPPGMSAAANQARIRMMMIARARALAAAGEFAAASTSVVVPKVTKCAPIRLSLWRTAGEHASRVWDVEVKVPNHFKDAGKDVKELEDVIISALSWSPDSKSIAMAVQIVRRRLGDTFAERENRFLIVYGMQEGKQQRVVRIPRLDSDTDGDLVCGLDWRKLAAKRIQKPVPGSALHIIQNMAKLPDIDSLAEEKEGKGGQKRRAFNAMRNSNQKQDQTDQKAEEVMLSDSDEWATCLLDYPRSERILDNDDEFEREGCNVEVLCAWGPHCLYLFLDAAIYLGSIKVEEELISADIVSSNGDLLLCTRNKESEVDLSIHSISTQLHQHTPRFSTILHLQSLSSHAFYLLTYCHDSIINIRNLYKTTHISCITPWIRKGKNINVKYSTHFQTEMQMLLLTNFANEIITTVLIGNETMTEGDLNKLETEIASAWSRLEILFEASFLALQRAAILFEEVKGCCLWHEQYHTFIPASQESVIETILDLLSHCQQQSLAALRQVQQEANCWTQFYKWFKVERGRQEAIRDQIAEPRSESLYNVLLIAEFLKRGFVNYPLESLIGIVLDKKTRGAYVENDEEEEEEEEEESRQENSSMVEQIFNQDGPLQDKLHRPVLQEDLDRLLQGLERIPESSESKLSQGPSAADLSCLLLSPYILTGPSKGLQERSQPWVGRKPTSLLDDVKSIITSSCTLFSQAFDHNLSPDSDQSRVKVSLSRSLTSLRSDALTSIATASGSSAKRSGDLQQSPLLRSYFDQTKGQHWLLGISQEQNVLSLASVQPSSMTLTNTISICCPGQIIDVGFYSAREVVALLKDEEATRIISFSLDFLSSQKTLKPIRCCDIPNKETGSDATQVSLNHVKDVAATLNNHGMLIYWDFVLLDKLQDEDQDMG